VGNRTATEAVNPVYKESYYKQRVEKVQELLMKHEFSADPATLPDSGNEDYLFYDNEFAWIKTVSRTRRVSEEYGVDPVSKKESVFVLVQATNDIEVSDKLFHVYVVTREDTWNGAHDLGARCYEDNLGHLFSTNSVELIEALILSNFDVAR